MLQDGSTTHLATQISGGIFIVDTNREGAVRATIRRWGNSLALRIPKAFAEELGIADGGEVELSVEEGRLWLAPAGTAIRLEDLLSRVTARNRHGETDLGPPAGREGW